MAREILKVRKVGGTLVVTLPQGVLEDTHLVEGDRVLIEAIPPRRILISKEEMKMPTGRRAELELHVLEAKIESYHSQMDYAVADHNLNGGESETLDAQLKYLRVERDKIAIAVAEKKLQLFELEGV